VEYIVDKLDVIRATHPECGVVILCDINKLDIRDLLTHHIPKLSLRIPPRGDNH
jgi:hypothetical protein